MNKYFQKRGRKISPNRQEPNIVLIGMPGSGKSTLGRMLARRIGYGFIDSDRVIEAREGKKLSEIIASEGREGFLAVEDRVNASLAAERCVIATGGSVIYGENAMKHLKEIGKTVYLRLPYEETERRLGDLKARGVALKEGYTLLDLYEERSVLYEKYADIIVDLGNLPKKVSLGKILRELRGAELLCGGKSGV